MDIFNRKRLAAVEQELAEARRGIARLKEKCNAQINEHSIKEVYHTIRTKIIHDPDQARSVYTKKESFMSWYENLLYTWLYEIVTSDEFKEERLSVFAQVRLADIVELWEESYSDFVDHIEFSPGKENSGKKAAHNVMLESKSDFNNQDYKATFLYPLLHSHIDFLICRIGNGKPEPILVLELFDKNHFDKAQKVLRKNDKFKENLFAALNIKIDFDNSLRNEDIQRASKDETSLIKLKSEISGKIHSSIRKNSHNREEHAKKYNRNG